MVVETVSLEVKEVWETYLQENFGMVHKVLKDKTGR